MEYRIPPTVKTFFPEAIPIWPSSWSESRQPLQIDQVAIVVNDVEAAIEKLGAAFNWGPFFIGYGEDTFPYQGQLTSYRVKLALTLVGDIEVELLQPMGGKTPQHEVLAEYGEGLLHLRLVTDNIENTLEHLATLGIDPIFGYKTHGRWVNVYLSSQQICGLRTELVPNAAGFAALMQLFDYAWLNNQT